MTEIKCFIPECVHNERGGCLKKYIEIKKDEYDELSNGTPTITDIGGCQMCEHPITFSEIVKWEKENKMSWQKKLGRDTIKERYGGEGNFINV